MLFQNSKDDIRNIIRLDFGYESIENHLQMVDFGVAISID